MRTALLLIVAGFAIVGCDRSSSDEPSTTSAATAAQKTAETTVEEPAAEPESQAQTATATRWMKVTDDQMNGAQQAQFDRALAAQKELGETLLSALTTSIGENGLAESISFCSSQAPKISATVAEARGVAIGRTSKRLRNSDNVGPEWVAHARDVAGEERTVFAGPNGELGVVSPIKTAALCTKCHGDDEAVPDDVAAAINETYPADQARGFAEGDLRGWFWVEVPPPS